MTNTTNTMTTVKELIDILSKEDSNATVAWQYFTLDHVDGNQERLDSIAGYLMNLDVNDI